MIIKRLNLPFKNDMGLASLTLLFFIMVILPVKAETIAISIPKSGDFAELGKQFEAGAELAMENLGSGHELFIADDGCDLDQSMLAAQDIRSRKPAIVTGMICNIAALSIADELKQDKTPLLVTGARSIRLLKDRDREEWNIWRMSPGDDAPAEAIANYIANNLKDTAFALIDDGTIFGRSLTDGIRLRLNDVGMEPQFADSFRAAQSTQSGMLRRLERSGVEIAFIAAATTEDLFTIAKDHKAFGIKNRLVLTEQLSSLPYLEDAELIEDGLLVVMQPPFEANQTLKELVAEREITPSKAFYEGYAAIELAIAALGEQSGIVSQRLATKSFETILGPVKFDKDGKNIHNPYKLFVWSGGAFSILESENN